MLIVLVFYLFAGTATFAADPVPQWSRFEQSFTSSKDYGNFLYEVKQFRVKFVSPTGRVKHINGFWDGGRNWKIRFMPDEKGSWTWSSYCSDSTNRGLHRLTGQFTCTANDSRLAIYQHGSVEHPKGSYQLTHSDGTPFFWAGCTAWNGTLKSTDAEWEAYLTNRAQTGYSVIQFVTTQWRGGDKNSLGQVAFEGSGRISINADFFKHLDGKIDEINKHGLVAAPVLLWALGSVQGRELSPGYYLPEYEAILLARYMVARYGGNQVVWILGGDGKYVDENEQRWKNIGRGVFGDEHPGAVALHPGGGSWIGDAFAQEAWLDLIGYQSGHNKSANTIRFINRGPVATRWQNLPPRVLINMEPVYEEIQPDITATDVRRAEYWSLLAAPTAGITYGANGIWPWLREGELIINHGSKGESASRWNKALLLPGSVQTGYLANFMRSIDWWKLVPAPQLLARQPGDEQPENFIAVSQSTDRNLVVAYLPKKGIISLYNPGNVSYEAIWFNPVTNTRVKGQARTEGGVLQIASPAGDDMLLVLKRTDLPASNKRIVL